MALVHYEIHPDHPQERLLQKAVDVLQEGGLIIYPTDTVYGLGCDLLNKKGLERIYHIKGKNKRKLLSFICPDLKEIARYAHVSTPAYKVMKHLLPGPYTFILEASRLVPKLLLEKRKTVGIRVPDHPVCRGLLELFSNPIISTSASLADQPYLNDPNEIMDTFYHLADLFLDAGAGGLTPSSIIDLSLEPFAVLRTGKGDVSQF
ncbi:threonylcarbamoyl-AMP synthase [bacterium]|nr:threonylcarbamoyl-AMP synthase [bacterium]